MKFKGNLTFRQQSELFFKKIILILFFILTISIVALIITTSVKNLKLQVNTWVSVFPKNIVSHLVDSDYFSISSKLKLVKSSRVFECFFIYDNNHKFIDGFGENCQVEKKIFIKDSSGEIWGYFSFKVNYFDLIISFIVLLTLSISLLFSISFIFKKRLMNEFGDNFLPLETVILNVHSLANKVSENKNEYLYDEIDKLYLQNSNNTTDDIQSLIDSINRLIREILTRELKLKKLNEQKNELEKNEKLAQIAAQVSHDIRSPLSALKMITTNLDFISEEKRILIKSSVDRITDISNNLLDFSKSSNSNNKDLDKINSSKKSIELLSALVERLISEKRMQFRDKININIIADLTDSYGVFVQVNSVELKRVLSNLINNSVESFQLSTGTVEVKITKDLYFAYVVIIDNGVGIPEHILNNIGQRGLSFGKQNTNSGSGLGIYHAKKTIEDSGGEFIIKSVLQKGTEISLKVPLAPFPNWFVDKILIRKGSKVVSLDDDFTIHGIWKDKFNELNFSNFNIEHLTFSSGIDFKNWFLSNKSTISDIVFLIDFELLNQKQSGLEIIEELGISNNSILITSRYEETHILEKCKELQLRLIPKMMASVVPILIKENSIYCLIDDDPLIRMAWEYSAKLKNVKLHTFSNLEQFYKIKEIIDHDSIICIDMALADGVRGTDVSIELFEAGYRNIYLATGYEKESIECVIPSCIKGVRGKDPFF